VVCSDARNKFQYAARNSGVLKVQTKLYVGLRSGVVGLRCSSRREFISGRYELVRLQREKGGYQHHLSGSDNLVKGDCKFFATCTLTYHSPKICAMVLPEPPRSAFR
jgi:hypothetical protein